MFLATIINAIYSLLKLSGLWERLLEAHKRKEAANVETKVDSLSDASVDRGLREQFTRKD